MGRDKSISSIEQHFSTVSMKDEADIEASESLAITEMNFEVTTSQLEIGINFYNSFSVEKNCENAFKFISRSAEQGNAEAQFMLGNLHALGHGTEKSHEKAYFWYTKSAIQGYKKALIRIHNLYQEDIGVHCRGQLNSGEDEWNTDEFKQANKVRELNEYRLEQMKLLLNGAMDYYTNLFKKHQSSKQDDPEAQQTLGFLYQHGYGVKRITRWAIECYTTAAEQGFIDAQYNLGYLYQQNTSIKFNYRKAFQCYLKAAKEGQSMAQRHLAYFYEKGLATDINRNIAIFWYLKSANAGNPEAQLTLGKIYRKGQYVNQDYIEAARWYSMAAKQGNGVAQNCLIQLNQSIKSANFISDNESKQDNFVQSVTKKSLCSKLRMDICLLIDQAKTKEIQTLAMHAFKGDGNSMYQIGLKYHYGNDFQRDTQIGFKWIKNAAQSGIAEAQEMLVKMFKEGEVIEQNYHKMQIWTKFGSKKNNSKFQCELGILYTKGHGVRCDPSEASIWFTRSAIYQNRDAQYQLGLLKYSGRGLRQDLGQALEWFYRSALQKNTNAMYELGKNIFYGVNDFHGIHLPLQLFEYAAKNGNVSAQLQLGKIFEEGRRVTRDVTKAVRFYNMLVDSENGYGQYVLALKYLKGELFDQNYERAFSLFELSAEKGYFEAKSLFSIPLVQRIESLDYKLVINMFNSAFQDGKTGIAFNIGFIHEHGLSISNDKDLNRKDYHKAIAWYEVAAKNGDYRAMYRLGTIYEENEEKKDLQLAVRCYQEASEGRECGAIYRLACMYLDGRGVERNFMEAYNLFTEASNMGHQESSRISLFLDYVDENEPIKNNYGQEKPVSIDFDSQLSMLENAAELSYTRLTYLLGKFYERNNDSKALKWYDLAAGKGISDAYFRLGEIYRSGKLADKDYSKAIFYYEQAIKNDHEYALFRLAQMYNYGTGTECDYLKAFRLYTRAANLGFDLAYNLLNIIDSQKDFSTSEAIAKYFTISSKELRHVIEMFTLIAEEGNAEIQYQLGVFYENSKPYHDFKKSLKWYKKASENAHREATYHLGQLYEDDVFVEKDYKKSIEFYTRAKDLGSFDALFKLASAYHHGYGVIKDTVQAKKYYFESANNGQTESQYTLGKLYETGVLVETDLLEAIKWYTRAYKQGYGDSITRLYEMYDHNSSMNYFDEKLFEILKVYEKSKRKEDKKYYDIYGSMYLKLGKYYKEKGDLRKALQYFSKSYNIYGSTEAEKYATLEYSDEGPDPIKEYRLKLEAYWSIVNHLDAIQQYKLGVIYYEGVNMSPDSQNTQISHKSNLQKEDIASHIKNTDSVIIKRDHGKAELYFRLSSLKGNQKARVQLVKMHLKKETKKLDAPRMLESFKKISEETEASESDQHLNILKATKKRGDPLSVP